jgi:ornithine cyclodeaminase
MTLMVDLPAMADLLRYVGVQQFLQRLTDTLEEDYSRWHVFDHQPRIAYNAVENGAPIGVIELMPTSDGQKYTFKYVNGHPRNTDTGKLNVVAVGMLAEVSTGYPLMISEMTVLTALRTAATSALAAKYLKADGATHQAIIGCGAQSEFQVLAMGTVCGLYDVAYYDRDPGAMKKFAANLARYPHIKLRAASSVEDCVDGAHVITTATAAKAQTRIVPLSSVHDGMHFNAIGGDCPGKTEFGLDVLQRCKVFVEYEPQTRHEGETQLLPAGQPVTELWQLVTKGARGRLAPTDITLFDSVGYALEDFSALRLVHTLMCEHRMGQPLDLLPELKDPRNLFGIITRV